MMDNLISYYGFSRMPFGRDLAPGMLHRHTAHNEALARIGWCIAERRIGVITGEVGAGKTVAVRAALAALDRSRHTIVYLPDPAVGVRGIHHRIVASLGGQPLTHHATLAPKPPTPWPPKQPNGAAPPSWSSRNPTSSATTNSRPSAS
jgi:type II secretory pathway predicted ATPase ExeA